MIGKEILNYRIISLIGTGGMGSVYLAEHTLISEQKVAIKVINANMVNDFTRDLLRKEAKRLASLKHQNIVTFHNYHIDSEGNVYLVMEYAEGKSLEDYINNINGLIVEDRICPIFEPILDAVGYAHRKGILHRDIKPANIIVGTDGNPKILDFGIAQIIKDNGEGESEEEETVIMGTPSYMSPEQVKGEKLDERSDIYSLGVLLHQMLTGNAPYDTTTLTEQQINQKVVEEPLPRMKTYYKYVSDKVQAVVDKATAKNPADRYKNTDEFKKALHKAIYPWRPKLWMKIAAVVAVLLIAGGAYWLWDYNRIKTYYYKDYTEQWGVPVGIGKLSSNEHSNRAYRFIYQKGKLLRVSHVNSLGNLIDDGESERNERPVDQELFYTENGKIHRVKVKDRCGKVLYVKNYNDKLNTMSFQYDDEHGTERTLSNTTVGYGRLLENEGAEKGRISRWWLEYDANGYVSSIRYAGLDNSPVGDENGIYGRNYVRDEKGRPVEIQYIGIDGTPQPTKWGLGIKTFEYDDNDNWTKSEYLTIDRKPALDDTDGVSVYVMEYDDNGNPTYLMHQDADGNLMYPKKYNVAGVHYSYDDRGFITKEEYLDVDRKPMFVPATGIAIIHNQYDENGYRNAVSFYAPDDTPVENNSGFASISYVNDKNGNNLESWSYGINNELTEGEIGYAGIKFEYDTVGNVIKEVKYGPDRQVCLSDGTAGTIFEYNDKNLRIKQTNLGLDLQPASDNDGIVNMTMEYDKRGNLTKYSFYNTDGSTLVMANGFAGKNLVYDEHGNIIEENFFDDKGNPISSPQIGYAKVVYGYDENGNQNKIRYYNAAGNLTLVNGIAGNDMKLDRRGNILENLPLGTDEKQAPSKLKQVFKYDEYDNVIESSLYGKDGKPAENYQDVHKYQYKYNSRNQEIENARYDTNGNLTAGSDDGWAISRTEYDDRGNRVKLSYFGADKMPCNSDEGWSSATYEYDSFGNVTRQCFFGTDGKPSPADKFPPVGIAKYDKRGNLIYVAAQNEKGEFINCAGEPWSIRRREYDDRRNMTSEAYFDSNDKPTLCSEGYHKVENKYDKSGNQTECAFYGKSNQPIAVNGYHKETKKYDDNGNLIEDACFDAKGRPVNCAGGFAKIIYTYSSDGSTPQTAKYYKADGSLFASQNWNGDSWGNAQMAFDWRQRVAELNAELPVDNGTITVQNIRITGGSECEIRFSISYTVSDFSESELSELKSMVEMFTRAVEEELQHKPYVTGKLYDKNNNLVYSIRI